MMALQPLTGCAGSAPDVLPWALGLDEEEEADDNEAKRLAHARASLSAQGAGASPRPTAS